MPDEFDPFQLLEDLARMLLGHGEGSRCLVAIEAVLRDANAGKAEDLASNRSCRSAVHTYLDHFGLLETLECMATSPDLIGLGWEQVSQQFEIIERLIAMASLSHDRGKASH
ncbi:hypothetical protein QTL95_15930 [Rhizobium sp. S152]|uniref:hypothetical protein n=1 Tax=Rhizobium sp. S152 TaxID=3055038 RepID=UPI0025A9C4B8|nr:hypothetical protein [Rhizobium sp. S152]MDM9627398.1 hypothetical protein [Rhizobium sp. S152]